MPDRLEKLINIVKKTGEKVIIPAGPDFDDFYVISAINDYEKSLKFEVDVRHLTEEELADKINRDIAIWKSEQENTDFDLDYQDFKLAVEEDWDDWDESDEAEEEAWLADLALGSELSSPAEASEEAVAVEEDFVEEERLEEIVDDDFASVANILANRQKEYLAEEELAEPVEVASEDEANSKRPWSIPADRKELAEEKAATDQYLEEISF